MDPAVIAALIGAGLGVGGIGGQLAAHWLGRDHRRAQTDLIRQDIYQQLTGDLKTELDRVRASLRETSDSLRETSAEAERLRARVLDLESRVAQLTRAEAQASQELERVQRDRDHLRAELAARDATIRELRGQVATLTLQATLAQPPAH